MNWPDNAAGDAFRNMEAGGLDFGRKHTMDWSVVFETWPPPAGALKALEVYHPSAQLIWDDELQVGYGKIEIYDFITYEKATRVELELTALMTPFGGYCDGWGVYYDPQNP